MNPIQQETGYHTVTRYLSDKHYEYEEELICEEPLLIRIEGNPYSVIMRTPGSEVAHAAGFLLGEGLIDRRGDLAFIGHYNDMDPNIVDVSLTPQRREKVSSLLNRRGFISQTSCGICGKELVKDLFQALKKIDDKSVLEVGDAIRCAAQLDKNQKLYKRTRGSHASIIFDYKLNVMAIGEDVGRHNALDKAIGKVFLNGRLASAFLVILSSRISFEMVQKAARAGLPVLLSMSRPTSLAVRIAEELEMTIACIRETKRVSVFSGKKRLSGV